MNGNNIYNWFFLLDYISSYTDNISNLNNLCGNGSCRSTGKCKSKSCKLESNLYPKIK